MILSVLLLILPVLGAGTYASKTDTRKALENGEDTLVACKCCLIKYVVSSIILTALEIFAVIHVRVFTYASSNQID